MAEAYSSPNSFVTVASIIMHNHPNAAREGYRTRLALIVPPAVELLRTRYVCEGWKMNEAGAERALRYFRAGCPDDDEEWGATLFFISSHGLSHDWISRGDLGYFPFTFSPSSTSRRMARRTGGRG
jgi:hypothetical protein